MPERLFGVDEEFTHTHARRARVLRNVESNRHLFRRFWQSARPAESASLAQRNEANTTSEVRSETDLSATPVCYFCSDKGGMLPWIVSKTHSRK